MCQNVYDLTQLIQSMELDEAGSEGIIQDGGQGVNQGTQAGPLPFLPREEMVKQLMLILTHLYHLHVSTFSLLLQRSILASVKQHVVLASTMLCKVNTSFTASDESF